MSVQLVEHRCHWSVIAGPLVHVPWLRVRIWPCWAVPVMVGGAASPVTMAVGPAVAVLNPSVVVAAVSTTSIVCPTSAAVSVYVAPPGLKSVHDAVALEHRIH